MADASDFFIFAKEEISTPALFAMETVSTMPSDSNALTYFPLGNARSNSVDQPGNLMSGNPWISQSGPKSIFNDHVTMAYAACLYFDTNFCRSGLWNIPFHKLPGRAWFADLCNFHSRHKIGLLSLIEIGYTGGANSARRKISELGEDLPIL
jgi:hypothetical protein